MAAKTRANLIEMVARQFGHYISGTATGGDADEITDTDSLMEPDDHWTGHYAYVTSAGGSAPEGEERAVTNYVQDNQTVTVQPDFSAAVASGDKYEILPCRRGDIIAAVNAAVREASNHWLVQNTDTSTVTFDTSDYDYDLPSDLVQLNDVYVRTDSDDPWVRVNPAQWSVSGTPAGPQTLQVLAFDGIANGDSCRLDYVAYPSELTTDGATLGVGETMERPLVQFVFHWALYFLHNKYASEEPTGSAMKPRLTLGQYHVQQARAWTGEQEHPGGRMHGSYFPQSKG